MPLIEYTTFDISPEEKAHLLDGLTDTAHRIREIPKEYFTMVIREISCPESWAHCGKKLKGTILFARTLR